MEPVLGLCEVEAESLQWKEVCIPSLNRGFLNPLAGLTAPRGRKVNQPEWMVSGQRFVIHLLNDVRKTQKQALGR